MAPWSGPVFCPDLKPAIPQFTLSTLIPPRSLQCSLLLCAFEDLLLFLKHFYFLCFIIYDSSHILFILLFPWSLPVFRCLFCGISWYLPSTDFVILEEFHWSPHLRQCSTILKCTVSGAKLAQSKSWLHNHWLDIVLHTLSYLIFTMKSDIP